MTTSRSLAAACLFAAFGLPSSVAAEGPLRFEEQLVMSGYTYSYGIAAADLDGDGDLDLTSADVLPNNSLYWFENNCRGKFKRHFIQRDVPQRLERHAVGDVDGDRALARPAS